MTLSSDRLRDPATQGEPAGAGPLPHDVREAVAILRGALCRPVSTGDLARHCGVAERTLNEHFRAFLGLSPMRYLRRLRLAAAREALLSGAPGLSVTGVAERYRFNHFGRFAEQYHQAFGESPSATLRWARTPDSGIASGHAPLPSRERPSIAVLPCQTAGLEPGLRWLGEATAEGMAAALASIRSLAVMVPTSRGASIGDPQRLARELGARYLLTGRIVHAGARLRIIVRLAESATGHHVWGDSFDGEPADLLELQDRVVAGVLRAIPPGIRGAEIDRVQRIAPRNLDSYGLTMRALPFVFASRPDATRRALELVDRAIEIDPDYGLATALAAWCHSQLIMYNGTQAPTEERQQALQLVRRAAILDDDDPLTLAARCAVHTMVREFDVAEALVERALARDPTFGWAWGRSGWLRSYRGESETAIEHFRRALRLDPNASSRANSFAGIGSAHFNAGRYDATVQWLRKALREQSGLSWANRSLSVSYARLGDRLKALESLDALRRFCPDLTVGQVVAAVPFQSDFLDRLGNGLSDLGLPA